MTSQLLESRDQSSVRAGFGRALTERGLELTRGETKTLQVNVGLVCNQACRHCHLDAGPGRTEMMGPEVMSETAAYAQRGGFETVDITGGAPELNPHTPELIERLAGTGARIMFRANLTALAEPGREHYFPLLADCRVAVVASFPSLSSGQTDSQRGAGVFDRSIATLQALNRLGYGQNGSGLTLDLVSNPAGAFLPPGQKAAEERFRRQLRQKWGLEFNNLFTFANVPLGRFRDWLQQSDNYESYMARLVDSFNPCALDGVMCRSQVSVAWDGLLYDCDFNIAAGLPLGGRKTHVADIPGAPTTGLPIAVGDHCYTCTAGAGFT